MQNLWTTAWVYEEIPNVQDLLQEPRERGIDSGSHQVQLVGEGDGSK